MKNYGSNLSKRLEVFSPRGFNNDCNFYIIKDGNFYCSDVQELRDERTYETTTNVTCVMKSESYFFF